MTAGVLSALPSVSPDDVDDLDFDWPVRFGQALGGFSSRFVGARGLSVAMPATSAVFGALCLLERLQHVNPDESSFLRLVPVSSEHVAQPR